MKKLPIGISDFKKLIDEKYYFVDKSLFIKEIVDDGSEVILLPRPRRFGKTLNMTMLKYFFEKSSEDNAYLFKNLKIDDHKSIMNLQGKYPVIYLTFKDIKNSNFEKCYEKITELISQEYNKHNYLLQNLNAVDKIYYNDILFKKASAAQYETSLKNLSKFLCGYYGMKTIILIDEYDVPIQSGYLNNYYNDVIEFMRNFLSSGLKDNEYLQKSVLTGILRIAKESIFSGLNNLEVCTILKEAYSDNFGFLENEVKEALNYYKIEFEMSEIKDWYNGYIFGSNIIYNPWSILNYVKNWKDGFKPYWVNTSSNDLVKSLLAESSKGIKEELESLLKGLKLEKYINEDIVMDQINNSAENLWSFLLFSGYLKVTNKETKRGKVLCSLKIPNLEVGYLYEDIITAWFSEGINQENYDLMLKSLISGDIKTFGKIFKEFVLNSVSYFDTTKKEIEKVYHAFVLGMLVSLSEDYEVKSNRESGYGRYDVMIIPRNINKKAIIIEFKKVDEDENETLEKAAEEALNQIATKAYNQELIYRGITDIVNLGIAFEGKTVLVKQG